MSRSWERKVQKNQTVINKQRKKQGKAPLMATAKSTAEPIDTFKGRSILMPAFLVLFTAMYVILTLNSDNYKNSGKMFWVTIGLYLFLALVFALRRPYMAVGKDYIRSRRFGGDRSVYKANIKAITIQKGYVIVEQIKGGNWVFSRVINRYPTEQMAERLRTFAASQEIPLNEK
ncbi:hypothetical protein Back11_12310 [Paenibacillus baekrokdamisoli]|uniref:Uncharacterized protein n=1 Tax=Paenibacillus baekrokdamisoli TaxID=1712516 RepID=A0A3G9INJ2_9BACL|nr:hypothetical protein [Paenibacillus baekrokdamisoli]MBB3070536.1 hypothetical protein [Paenibacillus baekrokdamisoli]BBH19886.1 hypothetical protein Back11_12310 [Paenibacillus baekrokdamisoli]